MSWQRKKTEFQPRFQAYFDPKTSLDERMQGFDRAMKDELGLPPDGITAAILGIPITPNGSYHVFVPMVGEEISYEHDALHAKPELMLIERLPDKVQKHFQRPERPYENHIFLYAIAQQFPNIFRMYDHSISQLESELSEAEKRLASQSNKVFMLKSKQQFPSPDDLTKERLATKIFGENTKLKRCQTAVTNTTTLLDKKKVEYQQAKSEIEALITDLLEKNHFTEEDKAQVRECFNKYAFTDQSFDESLLEIKIEKYRDSLKMPDLTQEIEKQPKRYFTWQIALAGAACTAIVIPYLVHRKKEKPAPPPKRAAITPSPWQIPPLMYGHQFRAIGLEPLPPNYNPTYRDFNPQSPEFLALTNRQQTTTSVVIAANIGANVQLSTDELIREIHFVKTKQWNHGSDFCVYDEGNLYLKVPSDTVVSGLGKDETFRYARYDNGIITFTDDAARTEQLALHPKKDPNPYAAVTLPSGKKSYRTFVFDDRDPNNLHICDVTTFGSRSIRITASIDELSPYIGAELTMFPGTPLEKTLLLTEEDKAASISAPVSILCSGTRLAYTLRIKPEEVPKGTALFDRTSQMISKNGDPKVPGLLGHNIDYHYLDL